MLGVMRLRILLPFFLAFYLQDAFGVGMDGVDVDVEPGKHHTPSQGVTKPKKGSVFRSKTSAEKTGKELNEGMGKEGSWSRTLGCFVGKHWTILLRGAIFACTCPVATNGPMPSTTQALRRRAASALLTGLFGHVRALLETNASFTLGTRSSMGLSFKVSPRPMV